MSDTTKQVHPNKLNPPNKEGKGGFGDNPQNRSDGGWKKEDSYGYQYNYLGRLSTEEFKLWPSKNPNRTMIQEQAWQAHFRARTQLQDLKEITDRVDGKSQQFIKHEGSMSIGIERIADDIQKLITDDDNTETDESPQSSGR